MGGSQWRSCSPCWPSAACGRQPPGQRVRGCVWGGGWRARAGPLVRNNRSPARQSALEIHAGVRYVRAPGVLPLARISPGTHQGTALGPSGLLLRGCVLDLLSALGQDPMGGGGP
eukprot:4922599-Alexandrium_andersonii.AAC.1